MRNNTISNNNFYGIEVDVTRMDIFIQNNSIGSIKFLKIDVERSNYEVLEGFGHEISRVKCIQTDGEYSQYFEGQKLYPKVEQILKHNDF